LTLLHRSLTVQEVVRFVSVLSLIGRERELEVLEPDPDLPPVKHVANDPPSTPSG
jgi:hypothetical protein